MEVPVHLLAKPVSCDCGRTHEIPIDKIVIGKNTDSAIEEYLKAKLYRNLLLVADVNTLGAYGQRLLEHLLKAGFQVQTCIFPHLHGLLPDEHAVLEVTKCLESGAYDAVLAVGSGVVNDIVRYTSFQAGLPYISVATAPSMDGYASNMAAMQFSGLKVTSAAHTPEAIFADLSVLASAPFDLLQSGFGDLIGKVISLSDWTLAQTLYGEYLCKQSFALVYQPLVYVVKNADKLSERDPEVVESLFIGLINSGIAMAMVGNSRPCSGSEHHCSHYWDLAAFQGRRQHTSHGLQVGYATHWMIRFYRYVTGLESVHRPNEYQVTEGFKQYARGFYGSGADEVIHAQRDKSEWLAAHHPRFHEMDIRNLLDILEPTISLFDEVEHALEHMHITRDMNNILDIAPSLLRETFLHAKELRSRYTIFDFLWEQQQFDEGIVCVVGGS